VELASFHPQLKHRGVLTFEDLMSLPFGRMGSHFILANMLVMAYGAMVAYLLIVKDTVPTFLGVVDDPDGSMFGVLERELVMVVTSLAIMVPLSMERDMASLACTSFFSVAADTLLVVFVAAYSPVRETVGNAGGLGNVLSSSIVHSHLFIGLGILSTAMACQHSGKKKIVQFFCLFLNCF
jgi:solute carrier family 38 (sodium-coupled neutral amino acid transporter), member 11